MISEDCRIESFFTAIKGKKYSEAINLANIEATEAERLLLQSKNKLRIDYTEKAQYVECLKEFISFIRYSVMRNKVPKDNFHRHFNSYMQSVDT